LLAAAAAAAARPVAVGLVIERREGVRGSDSEEGNHSCTGGAHRNVGGRRRTAARGLLPWAQTRTAPAAAWLSLSSHLEAQNCGEMRPERAKPGKLLPRVGRSGPISRLFPHSSVIY
jgi:hypothetical protein